MNTRTIPIKNVQVAFRDDDGPQSMRLVSGGVVVVPAVHGSGGYALPPIAPLPTPRGGKT